MYWIKLVIIQICTLMYDSTFASIERAHKNVTYTLLFLTSRYVQCTDAVVMQFQITTLNLFECRKASLSILQCTDFVMLQNTTFEYVCKKKSLLYNALMLLCSLKIQHMNMFECRKSLLGCLKVQKYNIWAPILLLCHSYCKPYLSGPSFGMLFMNWPPWQTNWIALP